MAGPFRADTESTLSDISTEGGAKDQATTKNTSTDNGNTPKKVAPIVAYDTIRSVRYHRDRRADSA